MCVRGGKTQAMKCRECVWSDVEKSDKEAVGGHTRLAWRVSPELTLTRVALRLGCVTRQGKTSGCFSFMYNTSVLMPSCSTNGCWLSETQTLWSGTVNKHRRSQTLVLSISAAPRPGLSARPRILLMFSL